jgi:hypothetical protein
MKSTDLATALAGVFALIIVASADSVHAETDPRFGTRSPLTCGAPVRSQPNIAQIKALIQCNYEKRTNDRIYLVEEINVQAGGTRAYSQFSDGYATGIDTAAKVLPIRGSLTTYQCSALEKPGSDPGPYYKDNTGKNCLVVHQTKAEGKCFKTTFGDWWCGMQELVSPSEFLHDQPPPTSR